MILLSLHRRSYMSAHVLLKLEKIPSYGKDHLSIEHFTVIKEYLGLVSDFAFIA